MSQGKKKKEKPIDYNAEVEKEFKKFSFIIPVYKTEKYLVNCIQSLLAQDYKNIEIILVLDGMNKKAKKIYTKIRRKDKRLVKCIVIKHAGVQRARNTGYKYATGDYVSFWDSDCYAEIGMTRMWAKGFMITKADFIYAGYGWTNPSASPINSEPYDPYLLTCYNYIATMFPMKREIFPGFDENIKSLQDWDLWLTLKDKGYKGAFYTQGLAFKTEMRPGISSEGCTTEKWLERYNAVRDKHGIKGRTIAFVSATDKMRGLELAEKYKQDFMDMTYYHHPFNYKVIYCIGMYPQLSHVSSVPFRNAIKGCVKVVHWVGVDVENLLMYPYALVKALSKTFHDYVDYHFCENEQTRKMLEELGINAEIHPLPLIYKPVPMPKEFSVYYEFDNDTKEKMQSVVRACPDIKFHSEDDNPGLANCACFLSITGSKMPSENMKRFGAAGRYLITNYGMLYSGNTGEDIEEIIKAIRHRKALFDKKKINRKQQAYYKKMISPETFKKEVLDEITSD